MGSIRAGRSPFALFDLFRRQKLEALAREAAKGLFLVVTLVRLPRR